MACPSSLLSLSTWRLIEPQAVVAAGLGDSSSTPSVERDQRHGITSVIQSVNGAERNGPLFSSNPGQCRHQLRACINHQPGLALEPLQHGLLGGSPREPLTFMDFSHGTSPQ